MVAKPFSIVDVLTMAVCAAAGSIAAARKLPVKRMDFNCAPATDLSNSSLYQPVEVRNQKYRCFTGVLGAIGVTVAPQHRSAINGRF